MKKAANPFNYETLEDNTGFLFWQVSNIWRRIQEETLQTKLGISQSQYVILASVYWLNTHNAEVTQARLSQHTKMDKMTVSKILKILEDKSYVSRKGHSSDLRANAVFLTRQGEELMSRAISIIESIDQVFFISHDKSFNKFNANLLKLLKTNENNPFNL
jgi:DNA-binding MarR family transcriptional regulator